MQQSIDVTEEIPGINPKYRYITLNVADYCEVNGIDKATYYRWLKSPEDKRKYAVHDNLKKYDDAHKAKVTECLLLNPDLTVDELISSCLDGRDVVGDFKGFYLGHRNTVYRLLSELNMNKDRRTGAGKMHNVNKRALVATAPNQVWVWDITYLYSKIDGEYHYLYAMMDLYSRKIVNAEVHKTQSAHIAGQFLERALKNEHIVIKGSSLDNDLKKLGNDVLTNDIILDSLTLHSDNGTPMRGQNMLVKMTELGITSSYSRPRVSNDNPHIESFFSTLKHCHNIPIPKYFKTIEDARNWTNAFVNWYNYEHLHSGINFITPDECHRGLGPAIMEKRNEIIRNTKDSFGNPISKKLFKMPKEAKVTSLARKSRIAEKKTKDYEYKNANKPEVA